MRHPSFHPFKVAAVLGLAALAVSPACAQPSGPAYRSRQDSNITQADTRSAIAPALPSPAIPSADPPRTFLYAARRAVEAGRTGEAQEALERAETRLLDRVEPAPASARAYNQQVVADIVSARRSLAARNRPAAVVAIDDALTAIGAPDQVARVDRPSVGGSPAAYAATLPAAVPYVSPAQPAITRALLPGHWRLRDDARYVWVPPETTLRRVQTSTLTAGTYVWRDGAYVWVPAHFDN